MSLKNLKNNIFKKTNFKRILLFLVGDVVLISLSCWLGFLLRFDGQIPSHYWPMIKGFVIVAAPLTIFFFLLERLYSISWTYISVRELLKVARGVIASFLGVGAALFILRHSPVFEGFPRSIIFISGFLSFLLIGAFRFTKRIYLHGFKISFSRNGKKISGRPVLIVGAGEAGEQLVRHILGSKETIYSPVGFVDDDPAKQNVMIHGVRVLGKNSDLPEILQKNKVEEIFIAMPSASQKTVKQTVSLARMAGIGKIKILPSTREILAEKISLSHLREISIEDLLGRNPVEIDMQSIKNYITNKTILVTGAAGSIGSDLCQQILKFQPRHLIALDQSETGTFYLEKNLNKLSPEIKKTFIIADVCDQNKIDKIFENLKPQVVFHAAAYKHVPLMEENPDEAIKNNIFGTLNLGQNALKHQVEKFVMISTDKAINPTSIMGASKRVCEMVCVWLNKQNVTKFCAVRFGNVLGSQGSVVPVFKKQIEKGGPVEVTNPEMKRYFMITAEACLLVMQAGAIGQGGEVFVLDMGKPIKIIDLAKEMIRLAGYRPDVDIPIVFTGVRPGEKLFEEILTKNEIPTKNEKIFIAQLAGMDEQRLLSCLNEFRQGLKNNDKDTLVKTLNELVPEYRNG